MSYYIEFKVTTGDDGPTIDLKSLQISGTPPRGTITLSGHQGSEYDTVAAAVDGLSVTGSRKKN